MSETSKHDRSQETFALPCYLWLYAFVLGLFAVNASAASEVRPCSFERIDIESQHLEESRSVWVSLPMRFDPKETYPVLYVLDAEWRFDLVRALAYDLSGNRKIPRHIIVGIPHKDWERQRGIDLTFSETRVEYDGQPATEGAYSAANSGGAARFLRYLAEEVVPAVSTTYATADNVLIGHSYGGYFGAYLLSLEHPFDAIQSYDPSIWFGDGEVVERVTGSLSALHGKSFFVTSQPVPSFLAGMAFLYPNGAEVTP